MLVPSQIVPGVNVNLQIRNGDNEQALGVTSRSGNRFDVVIYKGACQRVLEGSWLAGKMELNEFMFGVILHEYGHIKYGSFKGIRPGMEKLWHFIDNVVEDMRVEYRMAVEYPTYAQYFGYVLSAVRQGYSNDWLSDELTENLDRLFKMARFGVVDDSNFASFTLPVLLSARRRMTRNNAIVATNAIFSYLQRRCGDPAVQQEVQAVTTGDLESLGEGGQIQVMKTSAMGQVERVKELNDGDEQESGKLPGLGSEPVVLEHRDNSFVRSVEGKYRPTILKLREVFRRLVDIPDWKPSYDGELNITRQQEALMDSFSGDVGLNFNHWVKKTSDIEMAVVRDISISTDSFKVSYAEAVVVLLAAADGIKSMRSAVIDFSDDALVTKRFDENTVDSRIFPRALSGTNIGAAEIKLDELNWKAKNQFVFVVTDGEVGDFGEAAIARMKSSKRQVFVAAIGGGRGYSDCADDIEINELPVYVKDRIRKGYS